MPLSLLGDFDEAIDVVREAIEIADQVGHDREGRCRSGAGLNQEMPEWLVHGLDRLTAFLRQAHVPIPEIERAWRALATRRVHSIARVGLTSAQIEALGL